MRRDAPPGWFGRGLSPFESDRISHLGNPPTNAQTAHYRWRFTSRTTIIDGVFGHSLANKVVDVPEFLSDSGGIMRVG